MEELRKSIQGPSRALIRESNFPTQETEKITAKAAENALGEDAFMTQDYQLPEDGLETPLRKSVENIQVPTKEAWEVAQK